MAIHPFLQLNAIKNVSQANKRVKDCYRLFYHKEIWMHALRNVKPDFSHHPHQKQYLPIIDLLIEQMKQGSFRFSQPASMSLFNEPWKERTFHIKRFQDLLVQEVMRMILKSVYEPVCSPDSHGFRDRSSAFTALLQIKKRWQGVTWIVTGCVDNFFTQMNRVTLLQCIAQKINDRRFLLLIHNALTTPTTNNGKFLRLFMHIYLHELDRFVESQMKVRFYHLQYVRYHNHFILGLNHSKQEAIKIFQRFKAFLHEKLSLHLKPMKVTHIEKGIPFLHYHVKWNKRSGDRMRHPSYKQVQLEIPLGKMKKFARQKGYGNLDTLKSMHRKQLLNQTEMQILQTYNRELQKFTNMYKLASNNQDLRKLFYLAESSFLKTIAAKRKSTVKKTAIRLRKHVQGRLSVIDNDQTCGPKMASFIKLSDVLRRKG